jgi:hypothetical protein
VKGAKKHGIRIGNWSAAQGKSLLGIFDRPVYGANVTTPWLQFCWDAVFEGQK